jgi:hypothetical protein
MKRVKAVRAGLTLGIKMTFPPWDALKGPFGASGHTAAVEREPEGELSAQVERGNARLQPRVVALDPAKAKSSVVLRDEPGDRSLGRRTVTPIGSEDLSISPGSPCSDVLRIVRADRAGACRRNRAALPRLADTTPSGAAGYHDVHADVAQLVEHHLAKVRVAGSSPVVRSR